MLEFCSIIAPIKHRPLKKSFDIGEVKRTEAFSSALLLEIGKTTFAYAVLNKDTGMISRYSRYEDLADGEDILPGLISEIPELNYTYRRSAVSYFTGEAVQVPADIYRYDQEKYYLGTFISTVPDSVIKSEHINTQDLYNVYYVPVAINNLVSKSFIGTAYWHYYSVLLKNISGREDQAMLMDVRPGEFAVLYVKAGKLRCCMMYTYSTPEDVLYKILGICNQFGIKRQELPLTASGFIEKQSALYKELYKYFPSIHFDGLPDGTGLSDGFVDLPVHYFSSVCKLSVCV